MPIIQIGIPNSGTSTTLQDIVDEARSLADVAPALATAGYENQPALRMANTVMRAMITGGPDGQPYNWKWNRFYVPPFPTISWQQDYFVPGLVTLGWIESSWANEFNITSQPKPKFPMTAVKDLQSTYIQTGYPNQICWLPNRLLLTGTWGATELQTITGQNNPGPGVVYTNPIGSQTQPSNPITQITDPNGNLWVVTTYGTCGATQPAWPVTANISFPTYDNPSANSSTVNDGTVVWTAINPNGQGFRLSPIPPQQGQVWTINVSAQARAVKFTTLTQTLSPVPDDCVSWFRDGFFCEGYRYSPDAKVHSKYPAEYARWMKSLSLAIRSFDREEDAFGFIPGSSILSGGGGGGGAFGPAWPFAGPPFGSYY